MKLNVGDKVIIHHFISKCCEDKGLKVGTVINSKMSDDLSYHGSSSYKEIYTVKDELGSVYEGTYGHDYIHFGYEEKIYFLTLKDQEESWQRDIRYLEEGIEEKRNKIQELRRSINQYCCVVGL